MDNDLSSGHRFIQLIVIYPVDSAIQASCDRPQASIGYIFYLFKHICSTSSLQELAYELILGDHFTFAHKNSYGVQDR